MSYIATHRALNVKRGEGKSFDALCKSGPTELTSLLTPRWDVGQKGIDEVGRYPSHSRCICITCTESDYSVQLVVLFAVGVLRTERRTRKALLVKA